ncbi:LysM peptidoglycan-binding domain-containing protein [Blastococcus xanthinilyticus]|uniref:LysM domain-containing protein n=1 Tax=Blastococcus xanthinilyticus TaxID=1564164 RepID=A0A5S5CT03_9ACTN|nr:LysM domain-containing protein [Blastococcus xanthinilyticus]TYP86937.1 LysM domain-containing protein [Blastococcus xanthinilyticus]
MLKRTMGRSGRPARTSAMARPVVVLAAAAALSLGIAGPAQAHPGAHTVVPGDTLSGLAAAHGTTWQTVYAANVAVIGANPNVLRVGQVLQIGGTGGTTTTDTTAYGAWDPHVRPAVAEIAAQFGIGTVLTRPGHSPTAGRAADFMVYDDAATGGAVAQHAIDNAARLGVEYVIWQQHIAGSWTGWAWQGMADRGSPTANHMDHVHVAFVPAP